MVDGVMREKLGDRVGTVHTKAERINRLRQRLREVKPPNAPAQIVAVLQGVLDLLADEL